MGYYDSFFAAVEHVEVDAELLRRLVRADEPATIDVDGTPRDNVAKQIADAVARINGDADSILAAVRAAANAVATDRAAVTEQAGQALDDLNVALTGAIEALEESQAGLRDQVVTLRDEVVAKREAVATDRIAVSNQRQLAENAAAAAAGDAEQTAADRSAVTDARDRAEAAADQTAGLTSWESDGRVLTTPLLTKSAAITRADLPHDAPDGTRAYVPDCPQPITSIVDGFGAECIRIARRWVRLGDYGDIYTPLDKIIGKSGMYTRVRQSVLYRDTAKEQSVIDTPQTAALIADESPARLDLVQPVVSRQAEWSNSRLTVDGSDDGYATVRHVESSHDAPLFVALGLRRISGANNYDIINYLPESGISARVGSRYGARIYYIFADQTTNSSTVRAFVDVDWSYDDVFVIAFEINESGIYVVRPDGSSVAIDYRDFAMPTEWQSSAVVKFFGGQPNADFIGAAVCTRPLDQAQRAAIIKYVTGNRS